MRAMKVCSCNHCEAHPGKCPAIVASGRCPRCDRAADRRRGTSAQRGYNGPGHRGFRARVLRRDRWCQTAGCRALATDADHYPLGRDELIRRGIDPNDERHGRGLCGPHHKQATAEHQPGGWNAR